MVLEDVLDVMTCVYILLFFYIAMTVDVNGMSGTNKVTLLLVENLYAFIFVSLFIPGCAYVYDMYNDKKTKKNKQQEA